MHFFRKKTSNFSKKKSDIEIAPDEIFIDSSNLPEFDTHQFEGHLEKPITKKLVKLTGVFCLLIGLIFVCKSAELQIVNGSDYQELSKQNHLSYQPVFSQRGIITDKDKNRLAWNIANPNKNEKYALRKYTDKNGTGHLLGYIKYPAKDNKGNYYRTKCIGQEGVEKAFNSKLQGQNGLKIVEENALSETQSETTLHPPKNGDSVQLSIDFDIQSALHKFIKQTAKKSKFKAGAGVIMNVQNGKLLALTNYPEYDPEVLSKGSPKETIASYQKSNKKTRLHNI